MSAFKHKRPSFAPATRTSGTYGDGIHVHTFRAPKYAKGVETVDVHVRDIVVVLADIAFGRGKSRSMCWTGTAVRRCGAARCGLPRAAAAMLIGTRMRRLCEPRRCEPTMPKWSVSCLCRTSGCRAGDWFDA